MDRENRFDWLDGFTISLVRSKARQLLRRPEFRKFARTDIEQELVLYLLKRIKKYDPEKSRQKFVSYLIKRAVADLIRYQKARMRDEERCGLSLNDEITEKNGECAELLECCDARAGKNALPPEELALLAGDLAALLGKEPEQIQRFCRLLSEGTVSNAAREMGIHRSTAYEWLEQLRQKFANADLKEYLKNNPTLRIRLP